MPLKWENRARCPGDPAACDTVTCNQLPVSTPVGPARLEGGLHSLRPRASCLPPRSGGEGSRKEAEQLSLGSSGAGACVPQGLVTGSQQNVRVCVCAQAHAHLWVRVEGTRVSTRAVCARRTSVGLMGGGGRSQAGWGPGHTYRRWESRGAAAGRSRRARPACGSSSCTCRSRGPWCCAHTRTAGCPRAPSTGWRAGCTCTWGDPEGTEVSKRGQWAGALQEQPGWRWAGLGGALHGHQPSLHPDSSSGTKTPTSPSCGGLRHLRPLPAGAPALRSVPSPSAWVPGSAASPWGGPIPGPRRCIFRNSAPRVATEG